jgi:hypothetical protein
MLELGTVVKHFGRLATTIYMIPASKHLGPGHAKQISGLTRPKGQLTARGICEQEKARPDGNAILFSSVLSRGLDRSKLDGSSS